MWLAALASLALSAAPARDAGVPALKSIADGGVELPKAAPVSAENSKLKTEVAELRSRVESLESRLSSFEKLEKKVDALKADLDAEQQRKDTVEREAAQHKANVAAGTSSVTAALVQLEQGNNTFAVEGWLKNAEGNYTGTARALVTQARAALVNGDLSAARRLLTQAVYESAAP